MRNVQPLGVRNSNVPFISAFDQEKQANLQN